MQCISLIEPRLSWESSSLSRLAKASEERVATRTVAVGQNTNIDDVQEVYMGKELLHGAALFDPDKRE